MRAWNGRRTNNMQRFLFDRLVKFNADGNGIAAERVKSNTQICFFFNLTPLTAIPLPSALNLTSRSKRNMTPTSARDSNDNGESFFSVIRHTYGDKSYQQFKNFTEEINRLVKGTNLYIWFNPFGCNSITIWTCNVILCDGIRFHFIASSTIFLVVFFFCLSEKWKQPFYELNSDQAKKWE